MAQRTTASQPTVSVVIPTYNRLPLLRHTVDSVLAQTFRDLELIVVDDGSTDGTVDYLRGLGDPRVRSIALPRSGNVSRARNAGVQAARGEYLAFLDSDDLWLPDKLAVQLEHTRRAGARWSYTRYDMIDGQGLPVPWRLGSWAEHSGWIAHPLITFEASACICTLLVDRHLLGEVGGFDEAIESREDYDLVLRMALKAPTVAIPEPLVLVRDHPARSIYATTHPFEHALKVFDLAARRTSDPSLLAILRRQRAYHAVEAAATRLARREFGAGLRLLARAARLRARPRDLAWAVYRGTHWALTGGRPA